MMALSEYTLRSEVLVSCWLSIRMVGVHVHYWCPLAHMPTRLPQTLCLLNEKVWRDTKSSQAAGKKNKNTWKLWSCWLQSARMLQIFSAPDFYLSVFRTLTRDLFGTWCEKALRHDKTPATFRRKNRQSVCRNTEKGQWVQNGNKGPFHSVTLLALGCCTSRLSRKEKKTKSARSPRRRTGVSTRL